MKTKTNILIAFLLNLTFSIMEFIGGLITGSIAITSDSIHDLSDAFSIGISYFLESKSMKGPDKKHTYGYIRYSLIGSVITTVILLIGSFVVIYEALKRIVNPQIINYDGMIVFAIFGVLINSIASYVTREGDSLNQKAVNLHMLEDVLGWIVVLIGSIVMKYTNILVIDAILSIIVALFIFINAFKNLKTVIDIFLEVTPKDIDIERLRNKLLQVDDVVDIHHIHVRSIDGYNNILTMHVVVKKYCEDIKKNLRKELEKENIYHSTIELELSDELCNCQCELKKCEKHHHH